MAIVKAPLFGLGAKGQLGKALVYFPWKGLDLVREYVVPSNPKTSPQTTQRGYLSDAVDMIHTAQGRSTDPLDAEDVSAYALLASTVKSATTWFNQAVKELVDADVASKSPAIFYNGHATPGVGELAMQLYDHYVGQTDGKFYYGTSPTALFNSEVAIIAGASLSKTITGLTAGTKYFIQYRPDVGDPSEGCNSGIYYGTPT